MRNQALEKKIPPQNTHPEVDKDIDRAVFMLRHGRKLKFLVIALIVLAIVGGGGYLVYWLVTPPPECTLDEHCVEGYYCQEEKCVEIPTEKPPEDLAIQIEETYIFDSVEGKVDLLAQVKDPDSKWGLQQMNYIFKVLDSSGNVIGEKTRSSYILPNEEKYLVEVGLPVEGVPSSVELTIEPVEWIKAPQLQEPKIDVKNLVLQQEEIDLGSAKLEGRLINSSAYNFEEIELAAVLRDSAGNPIGVNYTTLNALFAGEERDFTMIWFSAVPEGVVSEEVEVEADVYGTRNFILEMKNEPKQFQLYEEPAED